jgi:transposase
MPFELDTILRKKIEKRRQAERDLRIWRRLSALLGLADGETAEGVAGRLGVTARQIRKWLKAFRTQGLEGLCELRYRGRVPHVNGAQVDELKQESAKGQFRTARPSADWIEARFAVRYSD